MCYVFVKEANHVNVCIVKDAKCFNFINKNVCVLEETQEFEIEADKLFIKSVR